MDQGRRTGRPIRGYLQCGLRACPGSLKTLSVRSLLRRVDADRRTSGRHHWGGSKVYASAPSKSEIWEYSRYLGNWKKIGGPGSMWVGVGGTIYGLKPDKSAVYKYTGTPGNWTKVGGPAASLIGGGSV